MIICEKCQTKVISGFETKEVNALFFESDKRRLFATGEEQNVVTLSFVGKNLLLVTKPLNLNFPLALVVPDAARGTLLALESLLLPEMNCRSIR